MEKTIFQRIADKEIPAEIVYEDADCLAFRDVSPQAPTHVLLIPRKAIPSLQDLSEADTKLLSHLWLLVPKLAEQLGIAESGYRVVVNCGAEGGQTVDHLHLHILGGRYMTWPPG